MRLTRHDARRGAAAAADQPDGEVALPERRARRPARRGAAPARRRPAVRGRARGGDRRAGLADRPAEPRARSGSTRCCRTAGASGAPVRPKSEPPPTVAAAESHGRRPRPSPARRTEPGGSSRRSGPAAPTAGPGERRGVSTPEVVVHATADLLAEAVAARLVTRLVDAQAARGTASVVLTGGGVGIAVLRGAARPTRPGTRSTGRGWTSGGATSGSCPPATRSATRLQAREALLDAVPLDPARVHPMPARPTARRAATRRPPPARTRPSWPRPPGPRTTGRCRASTCCMLGVGAEGHVASIFPESPAAYDERPVFAVRDCPKPPPTRLTLTFPAIHARDEVWLIAAGEGKAAAVALALGGAGPVQVPAAGARGRARTLWLLDRRRRRPAGLPALRSPASPDRLSALSVGRDRSGGHRRPAGAGWAGCACQAAAGGRGRPDAAAVGLQSGVSRPRRSRSLASASSRMASPSASVRRSRTYARWVLYGSLRGGRRAASARSARPAARSAGSPRSPGRPPPPRTRARLVPVGTPERDPAARRGLAPLGLAHRAGPDPAAPDGVATSHCACSPRT